LCSLVADIPVALEILGSPLVGGCLARPDTRAAIKTLAGIMNQSKCNPSARVHAAEALLDRGWGKSTQLLAPVDGARSLTEIKLVIIDTAHRDERVIEHDDIKTEHVLIEDKRKG
jgi:hypothetical protein